MRSLWVLAAVVVAIGVLGVDARAHLKHLQPHSADEPDKLHTNWIVNHKTEQAVNDAKLAVDDIKKHIQGVKQQAETYSKSQLERALPPPPKIADPKAKHLLIDPEKEAKDANKAVDNLFNHAVATQGAIDNLNKGLAYNSGGLNMKHPATLAAQDAVRQMHHLHGSIHDVANEVKAIKEAWDINNNHKMSN